MRTKLFIGSALVAAALAARAEEPAAQARARVVAIAPAEWLPALAPWVEARRGELEVETVALEQVLRADAGGDAPERIKRWLWRGWRERAVRYALLVGDADTFPVRFMVLDRCTQAAFDTAFYPSDLYYADVARADGSFDDWNGHADGVHSRYFGQVQGEKVKAPPINLDRISYEPEVAVGRWPVSTLADLQAVVAKTVAWSRREARPRRAVLVHQEGWVDAGPRVAGWGDALASAGWKVERQLHGVEGSVAPTPTSVLAALRGADLGLHSGHGSEHGWHACLGPAEEQALADAPPMILGSAGCGTAVTTIQAPYEPYLDVDGVLHEGTNNGEVFGTYPPPPAPLQPGRLERSSAGERLLRQPRGGAVVYLGCTTGAQPCALTLLEGFALFAAKPATPDREGGARAGDAWNHAVSRYWREERLAELVPTDDWYPPSIFFQGMKFIYLGDPSLPLP